MKKTEFIMTLVGHILQDKKNRISVTKLKELFPKGRSSYFRNISEIISFTMPNGEPLFFKSFDCEIEYLNLNKSFLKDYIPDGEENIFSLSALIKIGHLLDNSLMNSVLHDLKNIYQINGKGKELNEKVFYLSKTVTLNDSDIYRSIINSLIGNKTICFKYNNKSYTDYKLLSLCVYRDALYVLAFKDKFSLDAIKTFKITRFESITSIGDTFEYPSEWDVSNYYNGTSGIIRGEINNSVIRVYRESRKQISEKDFFDKAKIESNDLYDEYKLSYTNEDEFLGQLFVYAQDINIVEPQDLKEKFIEKAKQALILNDFEDMAS